MTARLFCSCGAEFEAGSAAFFTHMAANLRHYWWSSDYKPAHPRWNK